MDWLTPLLPATVIAAIILFILKEAIEGFRRRRSDSRKRRAFRLLLARECELNHWTLKKLREALIDIQDNFSNDPATQYAIERRPSGEVFFVQTRNGQLSSSGPLPDASTDLMKQIMLDVAALDRALFAPLEAAYDSAINLKHVRDSLINHIETDDENVKAFFESFPSYGLSELADIFVDLDELYRDCTNEELKDFRVR